ncbi:MAG: DUF5131 family protein [Desulfuromonadaceae bacterium]
MAKNSGISWCDHTWNPWQGCRKVSPGCAHCYMYRDKARYGQDPAIVIRSKQHTFNAPLRWKEPAKVFVCSWSDFFIEDADAWRDEAWEIMRRTPHLTYMLLTKRPENIAGRLPEGWPYRNVWLGVTAENQDMADQRIPILLKTPAALRFVSVEPMIGPVRMRSEWLLCLSEGQHMNIIECGHGLINWVICGGESGPQARDMEAPWADDLKTQCAAAGWPFFMKQMARKEPIPAFLQGQEMP